MVVGMNLNDITKKLVRNNFKEYGLLIFCVAFTVCMTTTMGMIQFSPSVTNVLVPGGSSQMTALTLYGIMMIGCTAFIIFAQGLFMRYKSKEIGVFISLGIKRGNVRKIVSKEISYIVPLGTIIGILLAIPVSFLCWYSISIFFNNPESKFTIGWLGVVPGIIFALVTMIIIKIITTRYIRKVDILKILKASSEVEDVKFGKPILGAAGIILIPLGLILFNIGMYTSHPIWGKFDMVGLLLAIIGVYLFVAQVSTVGNIVKKISSKVYYKNIVFFNLMKLKCKQYTLSLFIGTLLTAVGFLGLLFNIGPMIEGNIMVEQRYNDFEFTKLSMIKDISKEDITKLAKECGINITEFKELEGIQLVEYSHLSDFGDDWWWGDDTAFVSESNFNEFFGENVDVSKGGYVVAVDYNILGNPWNELVRERYKKKFYNISNKKEVLLKGEKTIEIKDKMSMSFFSGYIRILDDEDYAGISKNITDEFKFTHKVFNVDNVNGSMEFTNKFYNNYLKAANYQYDEKIGMRGKSIMEEEEAQHIKEVKEISPEMKRWWLLMPYSRIDKKSNSLNDSVVYLAVFAVIAITCLVSGGLVIGVKIINGMWYDKVLFKNITFIGAKKKYIKSIINKQIALIYLVPNILGVFIVMQVYIAIISEQLYQNKIRFIIYMIALGFMLIQFIVFKVISKKAFKECTNFEDL